MPRTAADPVAERIDLEDRELFAVLRRKWDINQTAIAAAAGVSQSAVSKFERGRWQATPIPKPKRDALWAALLRLVDDERRKQERDGEAA